MFGQVSINSFQWRKFTTDTPTTTPGTAITPGTSGKGSWGQIASALDNDVYEIWLWVNANNANSGARTTVVDIGVDPAGGTNYTSVINDIIVSEADAAVAGGRWYRFLFYIKSGSTVGARAYSNNSATVAVAGMFFGLPTHPELLRAGQYSETIGTSTYLGTSFTPGTSGAWGSWASLGTTTRPLWHWNLGVGINNGTITSLMYFVELAVGDGTNYYTIIEKMPIFLKSTNETLASPMFDNFYEVPAGATLYVRGSCSGTPVTGFGASAIGIGG